MRTSELERFQSHRRKSPFRSRSRRAAYARRYWWKRKLRNMGVPECMLDETVEKMHMIPAHSLDEAMAKAKELLGAEKPRIAAIPDGISVIVKKS